MKFMNHIISAHISFSSQHGILIIPFTRSYPYPRSFTPWGRERGGEFIECLETKTSKRGRDDFSINKELITRIHYQTVDAGLRPQWLAFFLALLNSHILVNVTPFDTYTFGGSYSGLELVPSLKLQPIFIVYCLILRS